MPVRVVVDSNVIVSALHAGGRPKKVIQKAFAGEIEIYLSPSILEEVTRILLGSKFEWAEEEVLQALRTLPYSLIEPGPAKLNVIDDEADNRILECALAADALYLITGDKELLELKRYRSIHILTPSDFLSHLNS